MELKPKVTLKAKNDTAIVSGNDFKAKLNWKTSIDLDLWCMYESKESGGESSGGFLKKLVSGTSSGKTGSVGFSGKGSLNSFPFIRLDADQGIGDTGGDNEENMEFSDLSKHKRFIICANIYGKNSNFAKYDGKVTIVSNGEEIEVPLTESKEGSWAVIALVTEDPMGGHQVKMINEVMRSRPSVTDYN